MEATSAVDALPGVVLRHVLEFLDHEALHAVERTAAALRALVRDEGALPLPPSRIPYRIPMGSGADGWRRAELWRTAAERRVASDPALSASGDWKKLLCLAHRRASRDAKLLHGIQSALAAVFFIVGEGG